MRLYIQLRTLLRLNPNTYCSSFCSRQTYACVQKFSETSGDRNHFRLYFSVRLKSEQRDRINKLKVERVIYLPISPHGYCMVDTFDSTFEAFIR
ncbi:hypothetical protein CEXT_155831 [Caerostris extrusa]|uniref:Uncharacterized protein n=1 Tax=Caerostris extrusa TaxID=172846 RepID=A0AAV4SP51_CAEEX|nr:hypothetical protein CEXT_155831 [Caerostris extrusa]